ncbi:MAG: PAS domain-containing protein [Spirochaetaceae bacterium]|nr:PAS domain-containing protein [Spirochaetaceae bacterium]
MRKALSWAIPFVAAAALLAVGMTALLRTSTEAEALAHEASRAAEGVTEYSSSVSSLDDPRVVSVIILFAILSASAAFSSSVSAILLRRRISSQHLELQQKVRELEALDARHNAMLSALPDLVFVFDAEGRFVDYLQSAISTLAVPPERFIGKTIAEVFGDPELDARMREAIHRALAGQGPQVFEYTLDGIEPNERWEARLVKATEGTVLSIDRDVTQRRRAEKELESSLLEKEALLKEIHHRVKNNLQIVSSLLSMQSAKARDEYDRRLFIDSQSQIRAMASVHDQLYRSSDFSSIAGGAYLADLVSGLEASWARPGIWVRASFESGDEGLELDLERAVPIGLIVNELVTNAYKYAFEGRHSGSIRASLVKHDDGSLVVSVSDDGKGLPEGFDATIGDGGMGYTIINALVMQLGGRLEAGSPDCGSPQSSGTVVSVFVPPPRGDPPRGEPTRKRDQP